ncbi:unnamed protein product [Caenorhabditis angaria]|uniref:Protein JTB n=1 Tax=Caenorhabditis angaria TaxID=860376 RepID=A0A9P1IRI7_9PELO|nr:unnamed protein product [Caenorhabditis angaria]
MADEKKTEEMIEYCSKRKISTIVLALIVFSILVFFIEELTEESEMKSEMEMKRVYYNHENPKTAPVPTATQYPIEECWKHEKTEVISECLPCKDFDLKAIKAEYCTRTGYYNRLNCLKSNFTVLKSCDVPKLARKNNFYIFSVLNFIVMCASYMTAIHRKEYLDQTTYNRLPSSF